MLSSFAGSQSSWRPCSQHPLKQVPGASIIGIAQLRATGYLTQSKTSMSAHSQEQAESVHTPTSAIVLIVFVEIYTTNVV